jgi:hypothetical protein
MGQGDPPLLVQPAQLGLVGEVDPSPVSLRGRWAIEA